MEQGKSNIKTTQLHIRSFKGIYKLMQENRQDQD